MRSVSFCFILFFSTSCYPSRQDPSGKTYRQTAEYEPTKAIWMLWPNVTHKQDLPIETVMFQMFREITPNADLKLIVRNKELKREILNKAKQHNLDTSRISFLVFPFQEFWSRDMGPRFLVNAQGEKAMADFSFNAWSYASEKDSLARLDEKLDEKIASFMKIPVKSSHLIVEGGDNEINSQGVLMLTESVQFLRNPQHTKKEIEEEYRKTIGATSFIWFKKGLRDDDFTLHGPLISSDGDSLFTCLTTNGHVDEYARFVNDSTILMAKGNVTSDNPVEKETALRLIENLAIAKNSRRAGGKPFNILFLPLVPALVSTMKKGDGTYDMLQTLPFSSGVTYGLNDRPEKMIAAASYLNFVIVNKLVLVPEYGAETDKPAMETFKKAFPDKKIVSINPLALNWGGGGMHCITQNEPF